MRQRVSHSRVLLPNLPYCPSKLPAPNLSESFWRNNRWSSGLEKGVFPNNSGFSYHSFFIPSPKQYMLRSEFDIASDYVFAIVIQSDAMCIALSPQRGLVNIGFP